MIQLTRVHSFVGGTGIRILYMEIRFFSPQKSDLEKKKKEAEELNQLFKPVGTKLSKGLCTVQMTNSKLALLFQCI